MPSLSYYTLQKAIYEKLIGNSSLMAMISGIYNHLPQNTSFPFVSIGDVSASDISNLSKNAVEQQVSINVWSREAGHKQAVDIMEIIYSDIHNGTISIDDKILVAINFTTTSIQLENDGFTYHALMNLRVILVDV